MLFLVEHYANDIEGCFVPIAAAHEGDLRTGHNQRNRNEIFIRLQAKVCVTEIEGQIGGGQLGREFFLKLKFFIFFGGVLIIRSGVVAAPVVDFYAGKVDLDRDAAITSVLCWIGAAITKQVVSGSILLYSFVYLVEVVGVEKGAPAGIAGEGDKRFLRGEVGI